MPNYYVTENKDFRGATTGYIVMVRREGRAYACHYFSAAYGGTLLPGSTARDLAEFSAAKLNTMEHGDE